MSNSTRISLSPLRLSLLALAIAAITGGCSQAEHADVLAETHANATPAATESGHDAAAQPMHEDAVEHAADDEHADHATAAALPTPPATPWPSDAPLRDGMRRMHRAVDALGHAERGHLDATQTTAAAQQVQDAANFMFANCKLTPEPDAALHGVLAALMSGAAAIKANPADTSPVASMREAVALYPRMFEDATWQADTAPAE
ncbi:DnrO protein [Thermomonas sp.]|uniref:DnrO protein n=1 Tax=Thermomonas sp. TaxID=1971895 RepID=UPI00248A3150|nr:DnrO protein [Thermomonas sp.]MDI1252782.1 DnrO protein [Thermomonas sp.]